jgi:K+-transporting ATPase KdpF subunit
MDYVIAGIASLGLFVYLIYALLRPEKFKRVSASDYGWVLQIALFLRSSSPVRSRWEHTWHGI